MDCHIDLMEEAINWLKKAGRHNLQSIMDVKMDLQKHLLNKYDPSIVPSSPLERALHCAKSILSTHLFPSSGSRIRRLTGDRTKLENSAVYPDEVG